MAGYATTKLSSKGQVVIPEKVRKTLKLSEGDEFVVIGRGDTVVLKVIAAPRLADFQDLLKQARAEAKNAALRKAEVPAAIAKVRRRAR